jgi:ribosome maturation factor RimP
MRETLIGLLEPEVMTRGYELVELEFHAHRGGGLLRIYIDRPGGETESNRVTVEDCGTVSRAVSDMLDAADPIRGEYTLEVSSPGFDRPLRTQAHFERYVGSRVHVESLLPRDGRRRWTGTLEAVVGSGLLLEVDGKKVELALNEIKTARLVPEYGTRRE